MIEREAERQALVKEIMKGCREEELTRLLLKYREHGIALKSGCQVRRLSRLTPAVRQDRVLLCAASVLHTMSTEFVFRFNRGYLDATCGE
jgi:hypothetical protein